MLELGTPAPDFRLPDVTGGEVSLAGLDPSPALLVAFICNHCPYVKHIRDSFAGFARDYAAKGVTVVAISSNFAGTHPQDGPAEMRAEAGDAGYVFPYLYDQDQSVARAYRAACTPDFFLFDAERQLVYRGQYDDSRPGNGRPVTGADLRAAVDAVLAGKQPSAQQVPSMGCNIKWRPGNEPDYFR
jgi:peroxiredoxin